MDGEVADLQQRSLDVEQHCVGTHHVLAAHDDTSGKRERTVEPCRHYRTAINLGVELDESALAEHLGIGLDAERGRVAMGAYHVESCLGERLAAYAEGVD